MTRNISTGRSMLKPVLLLGVLVLAAPTSRGGEEQDLIDTLRSHAGSDAKCAACVRLRLVGSTRAVPALAALLDEKGTAHAARYALEGLPFPEAVTALRQALPRTSGLTKAGLIDSLGWRRDAAAVPLLVPLLSDHDPAIGSAAASALGRIGGKRAIGALVAMRDKASPEVRPAVWNSLLECADGLLAGGDAKSATGLYRGLFTPNLPESIRAAAWRGLVLAEPHDRATLVLQALAGPERSLQLAALKVLRELGDASTVQACQREWAALPPEAQLAVLDAEVKAGGDKLPAILKATKSPHLVVRIAAWQALGDCGGPFIIPALARTAARAEASERDAARESLARLDGPGVREALLSRLDDAQEPEKAELLRALGDRDDAAAAEVLLQNAASGPDSVRLTALDSLRKLTLPETAVPLLGVAAKSDSSVVCGTALRALYAVCQASANKDKLTADCLKAMGQLGVAERVRLLPLLAELGTPAALEAALAGARDPDSERAKAAVNVLAQWPTAAPMPSLLELARTSPDSTLQVLALRACIQVAGQEPDLAKRVAMLRQAVTAAARPEEKKQALGQLGQISTPEALETALPYLAETDLATEAEIAVVAIAETLVKADPKLAGDAAAKVLAQCKTPDVVKRAEEIRTKATVSR